MVQKRKFEGVYNANFSLVTFMILTFNLIGLVWMAMREVREGQILLATIVGGMTVIVLGYFFIDERDKKSYGKFLRAPFTTDNELATGLFSVGLIIPILIKLMGVAIGIPQFSLTTIQRPFASTFLTEGLTRTFQSASTTFSAWWDFFIQVPIAGGNEEFLFAFVIPFGSYLFFLGIIRLIDKDGKGFLTRQRVVLGTIWTFLWTIPLFMGIHLLNETYDRLSLFLVAGAFRLVVNSLIYFFGFFISFSIGLHIGINFIHYIETQGVSILLSALLTLPGILFLLFIGLIVGVSVVNAPSVARKMIKHFSETFKEVFGA